MGLEIDKEKIIDRIKRCLKLGNAEKNNQQGEVEAAISMAKKLMDQYNVSLSEVDLEEERKQGAMQEEVHSRVFLERWEMSLGKVLKELFQVDYYINNGYYKKSMMFIGLPQDVKITKEFYIILRQVIMEMARKTGYGGVARKCYTIGIVQTLLERAEEMTLHKQADLEKCRAVVVVKNQIIKKFIDENLDLKPMKTRSQNWDPIAHAHGMIDGKKINLNHKNVITEG